MTTLAKPRLRRVHARDPLRRTTKASRATGDALHALRVALPDPKRYWAHLTLQQASRGSGIPIAVIYDMEEGRLVNREEDRLRLVRYYEEFGRRWSVAIKSEDLRRDIEWLESIIAEHDNGYHGAW